MALDVKLISDQCQGVLVLPGWNKSRGARLETFVAALNGKPIRYVESGRTVPSAVLRKVWGSIV